MTMRKRISALLRDKRGFTLAEMLISVLILLMVTSIVAAGVPAAGNAYYRTVDAANSQLLLSTTMTRLRDELGTAKDVTVDPDTGVIDFTCAAGSRSKLYMLSPEDSTEDRHPGIYLQEYCDVEIQGDTEEETNQLKAAFDHLLVSYEAANKNLYVTYEVSGETDADGKVVLVTFSNIRVYRESAKTVGGETTNLSAPIAEMGTFKVRILT